jgi:hypothetical protein
MFRGCAAFLGARQRFAILGSEYGLDGRSGGTPLSERWALSFAFEGGEYK